MSDRIPIGTHPGLVQNLVGVDLPVAELGRNETAVAVWLRRTDQTAGDVVSASLRNAVGGGGDGIAIAFAAGATTASATGTLIGSAFYLRVSASDANSQNLTGWLELVQASDATTALASLATLKAYLGITASTHDTLLARLLVAASKRIQRRAGRAILQASVTAELHDARGDDDRLVLHRRPVTSVAEVRIDGTAVAAASYQIAPYGGILYRRNPDSPAAAEDTWPAGRRHIAVDYLAGYASVPEDLEDATVRQAAYDWRQAEPGGYRIGDRGSVLEPGGSASYYVSPDGWAPGVRDMVDAWRDRQPIQ